MSGIEVAGIVLACVPLVFNAIDSYKAGKSQLAIFRKYGSILKTLIRELESQHVFFQNNLEILLKSAGVKNIEAARFGQDNADLAWIAGADERVRDYLDASYAPFCNTVEAYRNVAETIALRMQDSKSVFEVSSNLSTEDEQFLLPGGTGLISSCSQGLRAFKSCSQQPSGQKVDTTFAGVCGSRSAKVKFKVSLTSCSARMPISADSAAMLKN